MEADHPAPLDAINMAMDESLAFQSQGMAEALPWLKNKMFTIAKLDEAMGDKAKAEPFRQRAAKIREKGKTKPASPQPSPSSSPTWSSSATRQDAGGTNKKTSRFRNSVLSPKRLRPGRNSATGNEITSFHSSRCTEAMMWSISSFNLGLVFRFEVKLTSNSWPL